MSPRATSFELERFTATPLTTDVVLLELEGVLAGAPARARTPALLVERPDGTRREHAPVAGGTEGRALRASFAVPAGQASHALAVAGLLLDLPAPDPAPGSDRTISLAREVNGLRHELAALREASAGAVDRESAADFERDEAVERGVAEARERADEAERELATAREELDAAREEAAAAELGRAALEEELGTTRAEAERREQALTAEHARLRDQLDDLRTAAAAEHARGEEEAAELRRTLAQRDEELRITGASVGPRVRASAARLPSTAAGRAVPAEPEAPVEDPPVAAAGDAPRPAAGDPPRRAVEDPTEPTPQEDVQDEDVTRAIPAKEPAVPSDEEDTGPIPLRRRTPVLPETTPAVVPDTVPTGPAPRTLALAAVSVAALLLLVAILGYVL